MDKEVLSLVKDKKFTDFSKAVKQELNNKLSNHPKIKDYKTSYDKIQDMKKQFANIHRPEENNSEDE